MRILAGGAVCLIVLLAALSGCGSSYAPGSPQIRVTVPGGCLATLGKAQDVQNTGAGLGGALVPKGLTARAGLVCRYGGYHTSPHGARSTRLDGRQAARLSAGLSRVRLGTFNGDVSCPNDTGAVATIALAYRGHDDVDLWYAASGCQSIDNGHVTAVQVRNRSFYDDFQSIFQQLTRHP